MKKLTLLSNIVLMFLIISCSGKKAVLSNSKDENEKYITVDANFISGAKDLLFQAKKEALENEKKSFIKDGISNPTYLNNLDFSIQTFNIIEDIYNKNLLQSIVEKRKENRNVKSVFFINIHLNGDMLSRFNVVLIENFDGTVELFNSNGKRVVNLGSDIIDFTDEFMLNIPYSYMNKTPAVSGYMSIYKISPYGANEYSVTSKLSNELLNYQQSFVKKMYDDCITN